jgi:hypothetical protein
MILRSRGGYISPDQLIAEGLLIGAYDEGVGWNHDGIARLAHNHGLPAYREEFRSITVDAGTKARVDSPFAESLRATGIEKIKGSLVAGKPVIISTIKRFSEAGKFHSVLLTGFEEENGQLAGFHYHDPESIQDGGGAKRFVSIGTFKEHWRRLAIFVY